LKDLEEEVITVQNQLKDIITLIKLESNTEIVDYFRVNDALSTQLFFLKAILDYHYSYGRSRRPYLILRENLQSPLSEMYIIPPGYLKEHKFIHNNLDLSKKIQTLQLKNGQILIDWEDIRDIPTEFVWFENVWREFIKKEIED